MEPHTFINKSFQHLEEGLNIGACIPIYGHYAIAAHFALGLVQMITALACKIIGAFGKLFVEEKEFGDNTLFKLFDQLEDIGIEYLPHGFYCVILATQQAVVSFFTFNLLNLITPIFRGSFKPEYRYEGAEQEPFSLPLPVKAISVLLFRKMHE